MNALKDTIVTEDDVNLLVVIIDTNPIIWASKDSIFTLKDIVHHLLIYINAHLSLKHDNEVVVIASHTGFSKFLYPIPLESKSESLQQKSDKSINSTLYQRFRVINDQVILNLKTLIKDLNIENINNKHIDRGSSMIAGALSMSLCCILIKLSDEIGHIKPRMMIISVSPDSPYQYISIMNCIFSAQKLGIPMDVCKLFDEGTVFLQQASFITGGRYLKLENPHGFLQSLM
ncbi:11861_t:CDS:2, partial [Entrophospora sp. SA101]